MWINNCSKNNSQLIQKIRLQSSMPAPTSGLLVARACHQAAGPGVHLVLPGLLQLTAVQHQWRPITPCAVGTERRLSLVTGAQWCEHVTPFLRQLQWLPVQLNHLQDYGFGPPIASWCSAPVPHQRLSPTVGCHPSTTALRLQWHLNVVCTMHTQTIWRQKFHCCWSLIVEWPTNWTAAARPDISSFQAETENRLISSRLQLRSQCIVFKLVDVCGLWKLQQASVNTFFEMEYSYATRLL